MTTLQEAINDFYDIAIVRGQTQSPRRLDALGRYCIEQLGLRGLPDALAEHAVTGIGRAKRWDVTWSYDHKCRLAVSLKSILRNAPGTVPNRIDDLMGEAANIQAHAPEVVTGYLMVFDHSADPQGQWEDHLRSCLVRLSQRRPPNWGIGLIEASCVIEVDFTTGPTLLATEQELATTFDLLVAQALERNPGARR